uniref:tryptophan--tRNA ligase n=1 Tax=Romanomermis culicivorax TaxID=13658 RepID=A0A915I352_ROMCU
MPPNALLKLRKFSSIRRFSTTHSPSGEDSDSKQREIPGNSSTFENESEQSTSADPQKRIIFSGIQPTGVLHLGNYFGAVENWLRLQDEGRYEKMLISVVDLHALTANRTPEERRTDLRRMVACLLACGLDPKRVILFQQSKVPQHALLFWILSSFSTLPQLSGMPTFKEKCEKYRRGEAPLALFSYPVLQAADILLYKATHVPVGDDQSIHLQYARDMALRFNNRYCYPNSFFPMPQILKSSHPRVRNLRDPTRKMSKSDNNGVKGRIDLDDNPDVMVDKVKKAVTDFIAEVREKLCSFAFLSFIFLSYAQIHVAGASEK